jgi:replicative DNA helicase
MKVQNIQKFNALPTDRISVSPIYDRELELDVLYSLINLLRHAYKVNRLDKDDFYFEDTRALFMVFKEMVNTSGSADPSMLPLKLKNSGCYLSLFNRYVLTTQIDLHIERLREIANVRKLQDIAYRVTVSCAEGKKFADIKAWQYSELEKVKPIRQKEGNAISAIDDKYEQYLSRKEQPAIKTGFLKLDWITGGFLNGTLNVIASAQGIGKTTFALNCVKYICQKLNKKVLYVSLEMSYLSLYGKLISALSGISFSEVMAGKLRADDGWKDFTSEELIKIHDARAKIYDWKLVFAGEASTDTASIADAIKENGDIDIVFVDYLQLLKPTIAGHSIYETTSAISRELKAIAMKFDIPIVAINSINRDYSDRKDFKPHISDLRNSGQLEYDADFVLLLHRPAMFREAKKGENEEEFQHKAELIIAKNRLGEANFEIEYYFDGGKCLFKEIAKDG